MHPDDELLQRRLDGELSRDALVDVQAHLDVCSECTLKLERMRAELERVETLLPHLDHDLPHVDPNSVLARLHEWLPGAAIVRDVPARGGRFAFVWETPWRRWAAAALVLVSFGGVAYAIPGSPLRDWVQSAREWLAGDDRARSRPSEDVGIDDSELSESGVAATDHAGVSALPGEAFVIRFESITLGSQVLVTLTDDPEILVQAPAGAAGFTTGDGRITVEVQKPGTTIEVFLPRHAPRIELRVAERIVFEQSGTRVTTDSSADATGRYLLPLAH